MPNLHLIKRRRAGKGSIRSRACRRAAARWLAVVAASVPLSPAWAAGPAQVVEALDCWARPPAFERGSASLRLEHTGPAGDASETRGRLEWTRAPGTSRIRFEVTAPEEARGTVVEMNDLEGAEPDVRLTLPALGTTQQLLVRSFGVSLLGSDISVEDLRRLDRVVRASRVDEPVATRLGSRPVWELTIRPPESAETEAAEILAYVDQRTCTPLRTEFFGPQGRLRKVLRVEPDWVEARGEGFVARRGVMEDLRDGSQTQVDLDHVEVERPRPMPNEGTAELGLASAPPG